MLDQTFRANIDFFEIGHAQNIEICDRRTDQNNKNTAERQQKQTVLAFFEHACRSPQLRWVSAHYALPACLRNMLRTWEATGFSRSADEGRRRAIHCASLILPPGRSSKTRPRHRMRRPA